jgi:adenine deaminase
MTIDSSRLARRIAAAQGHIPADVVLRNARYLDVFSAKFVTGTIAIYDGVVVGLEPERRGTRDLDLRGMHVVPGFIDAHVHVESSLLVPWSFERAVLPYGTTSAICDPHELANVQGVTGLTYFLDAAETMALDLHVMMSSCVPATHLETNGGGTIDAEMLVAAGRHARALGLAEMMNVPGVLAGDPNLLAKLVGFAGRPLDGHAPMLSGAALSAYACAGIASCHESSELVEAEEKLRKGIAVWIREGSVAKDLAALIPLLNMASSSSLGFCTDDRNPLDIAEQGHIDYLIRSAIQHGVAPEVAYRTASYSVARHYGLAGPSGSRRKGAIAPGYAADLVVLGDVQTCGIYSVYKNGVDVREIQFASPPAAAPVNSLRAVIPAAVDLEGPDGSVHVIGVRAGRILTDRSVMAHDAPGVMRLSVIERYGHGLPPANAYAYGFGQLQGAIASSVGHDCHNLIVVGDDSADMRTALAALLECGGGFVVVSRGSVLARLALPLGGLMTHASTAEVRDELVRLRAASAQIGCILHEPFLQLAFLSLPVIPSLKLTDQGLVDVDAFKIIGVRAA